MLAHLLVMRLPKLGRLFAQYWPNLLWGKLNNTSQVMVLKHWFIFAVTFHQRNFNRKLSSGSIGPGLVRVPDTSRSRNCSPALLRWTSSRQVRGLLLHRDEASWKAAEVGVHEGARLPQPGRRGPPVHGPCSLCSQRRYILSQTELSFTGLRSTSYLQAI